MKKVRYSQLFVSGKKYFHHMNGVHVLTVIVSAKRAALCEFGGRFLAKANFSHLPICNRQIVCVSYFVSREAPVDYTALII